MGADSFDFDPESNRRDALFLGDCDDGARLLAAELGWQGELAELVVAGEAPNRPKGVSGWIKTLFKGK